MEDIEKAKKFVQEKMKICHDCKERKRLYELNMALNDPFFVCPTFLGYENNIRYERKPLICKAELEKTSWYIV